MFKVKIHQTRFPAAAQPSPILSQGAQSHAPADPRLDLGRVGEKRKGTIGKKMEGMGEKERIMN